MQLRTYVVEDNRTTCEMLVQALQELTCLRVAGASGSEEAGCAWLADSANEWDIVIIDLFLNPGNGIRVAERLQRDPQRQKVVLFSNYVDASVRKRCAQLGIDAVFDKSTELDALVDYCARQCFEQASGPDCEGPVSIYGALT